MFLCYIESKNNLESIQQLYVNTMNELNAELLMVKKQCEQLNVENQFLTNEFSKRSMEINHEEIDGENKGLVD